MKAFIRVLIAMLVLLIAAAACAQEDDVDLYAPMTCEAGTITIAAVAALPENAQTAVTGMQTVLVTLGVPAAYLDGVAELHATLALDYMLVNITNYDFYFPSNITAGTNCTVLTLVFYVPADTEAADYYFTYLEQVRLLAATGEESGAFPVWTAEPAVGASAEGAVEQAAASKETEATEPADTAETQAEAAADAQADEQAVSASLCGALAEPLYEPAYDHLAAGNVITVDDRTDDAKALQTLLNAFGYSLTADGWAGSKTFESLNALRITYGMAASDTLDAKEFFHLLTCLLVKQDAATAEALLVGEGKLMDTSAFNYLLGCTAQAEGRNYAAYHWFANSQYADAADRAAACPVAWPATGELSHSKDYKSSQTHIDIIVDSQNDDAAAYCKFYAENGDLAATLFIAGAGTAGTSLPGGYYTVKMGVGETWYGEAEAFGPEGYYETMLFANDETQIHLKSGYSYTLTVNTFQSDPEADDVTSETTEWADF